MILQLLINHLKVRQILLFFFFFNGKLNIKIIKKKKKMNE